MPGYVNIQGELKANGDFALSDDGQHRGGFRAVKTLSERNAILPDRQKNGMFVYVTDTDTLYRLDNTEWKVAVTVATASGESMKVWIGDAANLPSSSSRAGTKTLYIVLENGFS